MTNRIVVLGNNACSSWNSSNSVLNSKNHIERHNSRLLQCTLWAMSDSSMLTHVITAVQEPPEHSSAWAYVITQQFKNHTEHSSVWAHVITAVQEPHTTQFCLGPCDNSSTRTTRTQFCLGPCDNSSTRTTHNTVLPGPM